MTLKHIDKLPTTIVERSRLLSVYYLVLTAILIGGCSAQPRVPSAAPAPVLVDLARPAGAMDALVSHYVGAIVPGYGLAAFQLPEADARRIDIGQSVNVYVNDSSTQLACTVVAIEPTDSKRHTTMIIAAPPQATKFSDGAGLTLLGSNSFDQGAVVAPMSAVVAAPSSFYVMQAVPAGNGSEAHMITVTLGEAAGDQIALRGIGPGTLLVTSSPSLLYDGEPIRIIGREVRGR